MAVIGEAYVAVRPTTSRFESETRRQILPGIGKLAATAAGAFAGSFVVRGAFDFLRGGLAEVKDFEAGAARTRAVIASTGGAAGITAGHVADLAGQIQAYSGQTDDSIVASENLLLTFDKIKGTNFDRATKTAVDMAQALGGDAAGNARLLGRALQDPIAGTAGLARIGIRFTESQKATIASMVATGNVAGAQGVIFDAVGRKVSGSAKAYGETLPGQIDRSKRALEDISQAVVSTAAPAIEGLASFVRADLLPAFSSMADFAVRNKGAILPLAAAIGALFVVVKGITLATRAYSAVQTAARTVTALFATTTNAETGAQSRGIVVRAASTAALIAQRIATAAVAVATRGYAAGQWLLNAALTANPIGLVIGLLVALGAGIVLAYRHSETFRNIVKGAFDVVKSAGQVMWDVLKAAFRGIVGAFLTVASTIIHGAANMFGWVPGIGGKLKGAAASFDRFRDQVNATLSGAAGDAQGAGAAIGAGLSAGMRSRLAQVNADAAALAGAAIRGVRTVAGIRSPSTVFAELGRFTAEGFALGIDRHAHRAESASASMIGRALAGASTANRLGFGAGAGALSGAAPISLTVHGTPGQSPTEIARVVGAELAWSAVTGVRGPASGRYPAVAT